MPTNATISCRLGRQRGPMRSLVNPMSIFLNQILIDLFVDLMIGIVWIEELEFGIVGLLCSHQNFHLNSLSWDEVWNGQCRVKVHRQSVRENVRNSAYASAEFTYLSQQGANGIVICYHFAHRSRRGSAEECEKMYGNDPGFLTSWANFPQINTITLYW